MSNKLFTDILMVTDRVQNAYNKNVRTEYDSDYLVVNGNSFPTGIAGPGTVLTTLGETGMLSWETPTPQGDTGLQGVTGLEGVTGAYGGPPGETGVQGITGAQGYTGLQGATGLKGDTGAQGYTGLQGATGVQGLQGVTGLNLSDMLVVQNGFTGYVAWTGPKALPGSETIITLTKSSRVMSIFQCDQEVKDWPLTTECIVCYMFNGVTGIVGGGGSRAVERSETYVSPMLSAGSYTGYALTLYDKLAFPLAFTGFIDDGKITLIALDAGGTVGSTGSAGVTGAYGGPAGATGVQGAQGVTGVRGVTGIQGQTGSQGQTGLQGTTGVQGVTGPQGLTGLQGITGMAGATGALHIILDGGDSWISTGVKADLVIPYGVSIGDYYVLNDAAGSIRASLWKDTYANFPPTSADVIGTAVCTLANKATSSTSGWTGTTLNANDIVRINVDSVTGLQLSSLTFRYSRA